MARTGGPIGQPIAERVHGPESDWIGLSEYGARVFTLAGRIATERGRGPDAMTASDILAAIGQLNQGSAGVHEPSDLSASERDARDLWP